MPVPETFAELQANACHMVYLPRLRWRAEHSLTRLRQAGFENVVLVESAVDDAEADARAVGERKGLFFDPSLAPGEIATTLSMIGLWERVVEEELPYMLVFEDDVLPHPDVGRLGALYWRETPRDADFVFFGNQLTIEDLPDPSRRVVAAPSWCMHAYLVTLEGARRALWLLHKQLFELDRWLSVTDAQIHYWMQTDAIRYSCWNGTMLRRPYPISDQEDGRARPGQDVIRATCATGLFFQNFSLGSTIWPGRVTGRSTDGHRRPKAVMIVPITPGQYGSGIIMRAGVTLDGLARVCDVTLVLAPLYSDRATSDWVAERVERVFVLPPTVADPFLRHVRQMRSVDERCRARLTYPRPEVLMWSTPAAAASILEFAGEEADLVYVFRSYLSPLVAPWLQPRRRPRIIIDIDEYDPPALARQAELFRLEGNEAMGELIDADAEKLEGTLGHWLRTADLVLTASEAEMALLDGRAGAAATKVLPNPMPRRLVEGWAPPVDVLLVANFGYVPNSDAALWLCNVILPELRRRLGREVRVALAGSYIGPRVAALEGNGVRVVRDPVSVTPLYEATTIAVAPLRAGGGTRLKILEAFGHRRAVVSTSLGAEGLPVAADRHLLIADSAEDFAEACARALTDRDLRGRLVSEAVEVAIAHAWPRVARMVSEIAAAECARGRGPTDALAGAIGLA